MTNNGGSAPQAVKCIGIGRIFGHRFISGSRFDGLQKYIVSTCQRCGYHPEEWNGITE